MSWESSYQSLCYHGVLMVVANPNVKEGQNDLKRRLYDAAQQMIVNGQQIIGRHIPETYFSLIPVLEKEQQTFRSKSKPGVLEESTIWTLFSRALASDSPDRMELPVMVAFLKEAGLLLHYEDPNDHLDRCYFTQPIWLYNTMLRVVRCALEHHNRLFLTHNELCSLANISWSKDIAQALIRLMIRYAIIFPIRRDQYLITCLLPHSQPPADILYCGMLRRQFAPKVHSIPIDLWSRLLCSIISNLPRITDMSKLKESKGLEKEMRHDTQDEIVEHTMTAKKQLPKYLDQTHSDVDKDEQEDDGVRKEDILIGVQLDHHPSDSSQIPPANSIPVNRQLQASGPQHSSEDSGLHKHVHAPPNKRDPSRRSALAYAKPATIDKGVEIWESGMIYNHKGIKFSIFPCISEASTVEERGIEICCTQDNYGYTIMAQLCWLVQKNLEERFPNLFSTEIPLQKHELTQIAICPTCLERDERNPSCFLIETCVHAMWRKGEHSCRYHPEPTPLQYLIPDYLLLDFPFHLHLTKTMFEYNEAEPLHRGRQMVLFDGLFNGNEVAIKMYYQVDGLSITLPLSCMRRETDMLSSLIHPNIIKTFGFCLDPLCVLVEKAPLGNLYQKLMNTEVKINRIVRFHIASQVASALSYLHQRDIIYRTLKTSSILLWSLDFKCNTTIKLANFERAAYKSPSGLLSNIMFSSYPAPEMLRYSFREEYTEKVDIYSFGVFLYELVTRWQPYGGTSNVTYSQKPKLPGMVTTSYSTTIIGVGTGGAPGARAPPTSKEGGQCPNSQSNVCTCCIGLTMKYSRISSYKVCSDRLTVCFFIAITKKLLPDTVIHAKRAWFTPKVGVVAKISRALRAQILQCPPNHHHLPTPMTMKMMEECWQDESMARPSADNLLLQLSQHSFQCHLASQVLHDCVSVRGCCFVPSVGQIWVYGEYNKTSLYGDGEISEGTQVFILNAENLTVQGSLELRERATTIFTVDNKVWIGMIELCAHAYDTTTFRFTDRFHLDDSATIIADNDSYLFIGQANGKLKCYSKLQLQRGDCQSIIIEVGDKPIIAMVRIGEIIWIGCGNELVILSTEDEIVIKRRAEVCESSDQVIAMTVSHNTNMVWCISRNSHRITNWDLHTTELKQTVDLSEHLKWICCEQNYNPSIVDMVSIKCVSDTLWVGLSSGVILILTDAEQPEKLVHINAHRRATECLLKIPCSDELHPEHNYPMILSGGFGEISSLSSRASEENGVVMLWQAFTANEFSTISKRHSNYVANY